MRLQSRTVPRPLGARYPDPTSTLFAVGYPVHQPRDIPPATTWSSPVTKEEASEARYTAAPIISSHSATRRCRVAPPAVSRNDGSTFAVPCIIVELKGPGDNVFTRTPISAHSFAITLVKLRRAALT